MKKTIVSLLSLGAITLTSHADVKLPAIFSDHMVLQRDAKVPIWGWADPGEKITVSIAGQKAGTTTGKNGQWRVDLEPMIPGQTHTLTVKGKNTVTAKDVLIGDVWLGSGQSNMAMRVASSNDYDKEKQEANHPGIRMFTVSSGTALEPAADCRGKWVICSPDTVGGFSATAYFFGRELHDKLNVPVGLINSSVGGTPIEAWISRSAQHAAPRLTKLISQVETQAGNYDPAANQKRYDTQLAAWKTKAAAAKKSGKRAPRKPRAPQQPQLGSGYPGALFNGKINPLVPFALKGGIWYQGERNSVPTGAELYRHQLPVLIKDWRTRWGQGDFPFAWVQLPNYETATRDWPTIRESMLVSLKVPNTGMAITIDVGDPKDIHPKNKQAVGLRLAVWALGKVYGFPIATSGPLATKHWQQGSGIIVTFDHTNEGLVPKGGKLTGFELANAKGEWHPANASIDGESVLVTSAKVKAPTAVRYAWSNNPVCNLYNGAGLPASPFRLGSK
jgi:sialate O-acetylesterase